MVEDSLVVGQDGQIVASDCIADTVVTRVMAQSDYLSVKVEGVVRPWPTALHVSVCCGPVLGTGMKRWCRLVRKMVKMGNLTY